MNEWILAVQKLLDWIDGHPSLTEISRQGAIFVQQKPRRSKVVAILNITDKYDDSLFQ